jgi:hypothetical protein
VPGDAVDVGHRCRAPSRRWAAGLRRVRLVLDKPEHVPSPTAEERM